MATALGFRALERGSHLEVSSRKNAARNIIAGLMTGYGFVSFICFIAMEQMWAGAAPRRPMEALGLIYRHDDHGSYTYFSQFQATACGLIFISSIPIAMIGVLLAPKHRSSGRGLHWDPDDPGGLVKWTMALSAIGTPLFLYFLGPHIVRGLIAIGFAMNLG